MHDEGVKLSPICMGLLVSGGGSILCMLAVAIVITLALVASGTAFAEVTDELFRVSEVPALVGVDSAVAFGWVVVGGYVAGRMAPHAPVTHAVLLGSAMTAFDVHLAMAGVSGASVTSIATHCGWVPAALLGAIFARNRRVPATPLTASRVP